MSALSAFAAATLASLALATAPPPIPQAGAAPDAEDAQPADPGASQAGASQPGAPGADDQTPAVLAAYQAAESMQGPLDGLWRVQDHDGRTLFIFSLSDAGRAPAPMAASPDHPGVEGAWRDPGRAGSPDGSGFLDSVRRDGGRLAIRFAAGPDGQPRTLILTAARDDRWIGELEGAGAHQAVVMIRF